MARARLDFFADGDPGDCPFGSVVHMTRPFTEYRDTPLWKAVTSIVSELQATGEIRVATAPDYVIGYCCRELAAKKVATKESLVAESTNES